MHLRLNLRAKYIISVTILTIITSFIMSFYFISDLSKVQNQDMEQHGKTLTKGLANILSVSLQSDGKGNTDNLLLGLLQETDVVYAGILNQNKRFDDFKSKYRFTTAIVPQNFINLINEDEFIFSKFLTYKYYPKEMSIFKAKSQDYELPDILTVVAPIYIKENIGTSLNVIFRNKIISYAVVGISINVLEQNIKQSTRASLIITFYVIVIGLLVAILLTNTITRPLQKLVEGTQRVADGDYTYKADIKLTDEVGTLAKSFNLMTDRINEAKQKLDEYSHLLEKKVRERTMDLEEKTIKLADALEKAKESDRLKSEFLTNMSHELRTPLNAVIGFSDVLLQGIDGELLEPQKEDMVLINNSGKHLLSLINSILDISKIEAGKMEINYDKINVSDLCRDVINLARGLVNDKKIELRIDIPEKGLYLEADKLKIKQILLNLLSNSIKFTEEGFVVLKVSFSETEYLFEISDTGIGIAQKDIPTIFEKFRQVDGSYTRNKGGTGLGMAIVKEFVNMHSGRITISSELGKGTTFLVAIPLTKLPIPEKKPVDFSKLQQKMKNVGEKRILIIEDEESLSALMKRYLELEGYFVHTITDSRDIFKIIEAIKPYAIILDILLPYKDGWEVLKEIKDQKNTQNIPVILCSVVQNKELGFSLGAADYLVKPVEQQGLLEAIHNLEKDTQKILIIENSEEDIDLIKVMLETAPKKYNIYTALDGEKGLELMEKYKPDLVILDLILSKINDFALIERIKKNKDLKNIPILVMATKDLKENEKRYLERGIEHLFKKSSFTSQELLSEISANLSNIKNS